MNIEHSGDVLDQYWASFSETHCNVPGWNAKTTLSNIKYKYSSYASYICRTEYKLVSHNATDMCKILIQTNRIRVLTCDKGLYITQQN